MNIGMSLTTEYDHESPVEFASEATTFICRLGPWLVLCSETTINGTILIEQIDYYNLHASLHLVNVEAATFHNKRLKSTFSTIVR